MLTLDHISKTFNPGTINEKRALDGLSLHLKPGDFVTVIGGNGAGKSTMLNAVAGVWPVDSGRIILDGVDVTAMPEYRRAQYIGRVFQDPMMARQRTCRLRKTSPSPRAVARSARCAGASRRRSARNIMRSSRALASALRTA